MSRLTFDSAEHLKAYAHLQNKPILASWMGGPAVADGEQTLRGMGIPTFSYPDSAARAFNYMWRYDWNLRNLYETPMLATHDGDSPDRAAVAWIIETARAADRTILTEFESKQVLAAYGIPTVETYIATNMSDAAAFAEKIGYPVVLKLYSETITHKTDVGGVALNLSDAQAVENAYRTIQAAVTEKVGAAHFQGVTVQPMIRLDGYEIILGSSIDAQFGPVLLFGMGGQLVEVFKDRALGFPPLNTTLARRMMEQTHIYKALQGVRGRQPVDLAALAELLVRFSQLIAEQSWIKESDINPLLVSPDRMLALDARIVLHGSDMSADTLPTLAIRPYPAQYAQLWTMKDATPVLIRPIRPEDEPLMIQFHGTLSERSVYMRYFSQPDLGWRVAHERLARICFIDYDRQMALVVDHHDPVTNVHEILGVGRLAKLHGSSEAEFAILIADRAQGLGLGKELLLRLLQVGRDEKLRRIVGYILTDNEAMRRICKEVGFHLVAGSDFTTIKVEIDLAL